MATTTKEKIEIMQAYERGEQIQIYDSIHNEWKDIKIPSWDWMTSDYRIKSKFHDGDILFLEDTHSWIFIYKENESKEYIYQYVAVPACTTDSSVFITDSPLGFKVSKIRFATEEEKQKLFDCIKANGFHWNDETKTLEILIKPKFKAGDRIRHKLNGNTYKVSSFLSNVCGGGVYNLDGINEIIGKMIDIKEQDNYELLPNKFDITTLKPFDKVLVRDENGQKWMCDIFSYYDDKNPRYPFWGVGRSNSKQCIPYKGNEHLLGTTNDCDEFYKNW